MNKEHKRYQISKILNPTLLEVPHKLHPVNKVEDNVKNATFEISINDYVSLMDYIEELEAKVIELSKV